jgi:hypothetical protein
MLMFVTEDRRCRSDSTMPLSSSMAALSDDLGEDSTPFPSN